MPIPTAGDLKPIRGFRKPRRLQMHIPLRADGRRERKPPGACVSGASIRRGSVDLRVQGAVGQLHADRIADLHRRSRAQDAPGGIARDAVAASKHRFGREVLEMGAQRVELLVTMVQPEVGSPRQPKGQLPLAVAFACKVGAAGREPEFEASVGVLGALQLLRHGGAQASR